MIPKHSFSQHAHVPNAESYREQYKASCQSPDAFWANWSRKLLPWSTPFECTSRLPSEGDHWRKTEWFPGGRINASAACLDQHASSAKKGKAALIWEGEDGSVRSYRYDELHEEVCRFAGALAKLGVEPGDRVAIYLPLIPEAIMAMLACARIGAPHTVIFAGFSADAVRERLNDAGCKLLITADGGYRRGKVIPLKDTVDEALASRTPVSKVLVVKHTAAEVALHEPRDVWLEDVLRESEPVWKAQDFPSDHPLFLLYTSGSTGKPKGILHTTGGYLTGAGLSARMIFDLKDEDRFWCTADVGWITGHSYLTYGPLINGATIFLYEGTPDYPDCGQFWRMVERHRITTFYTAPTAIRALIRAGEDIPKQYDLSSLRLLGTVGEPINDEAWLWYHRVIGQERCPIVDTWWQTETGSIMITTLPGAHATKPASAGFPFFGVDAAVVRDDGTPCEANEAGLLVLRSPWPSMLRTIYGDDQRCENTYWSKIPGCYFAGDGAYRDEDGYFWISGRVDDVLNVAGHRLGTAEIESALVAHPQVAEAAVVGRPHDIKGQAVVAFVICRENGQDTPQSSAPFQEELRNEVAKHIGGIAKPDEIRFVNKLPKTRSGKIMRRLLRQAAAGEEITGDLSTLEDQEALAELQQTTPSSL